LSGPSWFRERGRRCCSAARTWPTTHANPTYIVDDVVHYCVTNMPGAVGRTSTYALTNVTLPYALQLANKGLDRACKENASLALGVNIKQGKVTNKAVAETFGLEYAPLA
jgi:alanine dehydrogenase